MNKDKCVIDKALLAQIIQELKCLELHRYEDYGRLVGCVTLLTQAYSAIQKEDSIAEEVKTDG